MSKKIRRPQATKVVMPGGNKQMAVDFQELRRSSAASPHRNKARYNAKAERQGKQRGEW